MKRVGFIPDPAPLATTPADAVDADISTSAEPDADPAAEPDKKPVARKSRRKADAD